MSKHGQGAEETPAEDVDSNVEITGVPHGVSRTTAWVRLYAVVRYGVLSGYAAGVVYALAAIPITYAADTFAKARVWVLTVAAIWWSLCVIFQSLSNKFWQLLLARIGMGLGQSCVEPLSVSLTSDLVGGWCDVFIGEAGLYVGVYIGEAISGQIATAFTDNEAGWRIALRAIGITGLIVAVVLRLVVRNVDRSASIVGNDQLCQNAVMKSHAAQARYNVEATLSYHVHIRSFWLLLAPASARQLARNVFGYYMPSYLGISYPDKASLLSRYGIIVGVGRSVAVLTRGALTSVLWSRTQTTPPWLMGIGGMISNGSQGRDVSIVYGSMSIAYLTAELWLDTLNGLMALLLPSIYMAFGLAILAAVQVLVYPSGPRIICLALRNTDPGSGMYSKALRLVLAIIITVCYWLAGIGFLLAVPLLKQDVALGLHFERPISHRRKIAFYSTGAVMVCLVVALFVASIVYAVE